MSKFLKIAWRNIWRNRRRSLITMGAIVFAILITGVTRSLQYGTYDALESYAVRLLVGELQLQNKGFHEHQTLTYSFPEKPVSVGSAGGRVRFRRSVCQAHYQLRAGGLCQHQRRRDDYRY
ncbi:MAG: hypothetical protein Q9P14_16355 [candidate division KSB1 bacterium]|nr:hypothetical protein [candidate division KSB1 bacterium]